MKHAYLIIAHNNFSQLLRLIGVLDHQDNDIFIHPDVKWKEFDEKAVSEGCKSSGLFIVDRTDVIWGDYSQIACEMALFEAAVKKGGYGYLHLMSGADFPLRPIEQINAFFEERFPAEFVYYDQIQDVDKFARRCREYHFLQRYTGRHKNAKGFLSSCENTLLKLQRALGINRLREDGYHGLAKGSNWVSVTYPFAEYLVARKKQIERQFRYTVCCDEVFLQTYLKQSPYYRNLFRMGAKDRNGFSFANMVYTDWQRGKPYTFQSADYDELIRSPYLFARKFDEKSDPAILDKLERRITGETTE